LDEEFRTSTCGKSILPGSIWSEEIRGTCPSSGFLEPRTA
jgi:hypothetical protein